MTNDSKTPCAADKAELIELVQQVPVTDRDAVGYTSKTLIQGTFPHSKPKSNEVVLVNGDTTITMYSSGGLPYGVYPRLIMCWLTLEAKRRIHLPVDEARKIPIGDSLNGFMKQLGILPTGGRWGSITAIKTQMSRLLKTVITVAIDYDSGEGIQNALVADSAMLWWDTKQADQMPLVPGYIELSRAFFEDLTRSAVPVDLDILKVIRKSPLSIDLYMWLTYRMSTLKKSTLVSWDQLHDQFGTGYPNDKRGRFNFKKKCIEALERVKETWPEVKAKPLKEGIWLLPSAPSVAKKDARELNS